MSTPWPTWTLVVLLGAAPTAVALVARTRHRRPVGAVVGGLGIVLAGVGVQTTVSSHALHLITMDFPVTQVLTNAATVLAPVAVVAAGLVLVLAGLAGRLGDRVLGGTATAVGVLVGIVVAAALLALAFQPLSYRGGTVQETPIWAAAVTGLATVLLIVVVTRWWAVAALTAPVAAPPSAAPPSRSPWLGRRGVVRWGALAVLVAVVAVAALWSRDRVSDRLDLTALISDPSLAGCVASALGIPVDQQVSERELSGVTQLNCVGDLDAGGPITSLAGIDVLPDLSGLELTTNAISDLGPLTGLPELRSLALSDNQVSDVTPLAGLTLLDHVTLYGNQVADPSPLCRLPVLTHLDLTFNQVTDAGTLAGCPAVEQLSLGANPLTDLTPLLELPSLIGVDLSETDPTGLTGIDELRARGVYVGGLA
jgi:hypothetical protein